MITLDYLCAFLLKNEKRLIQGTLLFTSLGAKKIYNRHFLERY